MRLWLIPTQLKLPAANLFVCVCGHTLIVYHVNASILLPFNYDIDDMIIFQRFDYFRFTA